MRVVQAWKHIYYKRKLFVRSKISLVMLERRALLHTAQEGKCISDIFVLLVGTIAREKRMQHLELRLRLYLLRTLVNMDP